MARYALKAISYWILETEDIRESLELMEFPVFDDDTLAEFDGHTNEYRLLEEGE